VINCRKQWTTSSSDVPSVEWFGVSCYISKLHLQDVVFVQEERVLEWWLRNRKLLHKHMCKGFDSLFFLAGGHYGRRGMRGHSMDNPLPQLVWR
jgi:hypothetical protein